MGSIEDQEFKKKPSQEVTQKEPVKQGEKQEDLRKDILEDPKGNVPKNAETNKDPSQPWRSNAFGVEELEIEKKSGEREKEMNDLQLKMYELVSEKRKQEAL